MGRPELWHAISEKEALLAGAEDEFDADRFSELEDVIQLHDGYTTSKRRSRLSRGFSIPSVEGNIKGDVSSYYYRNVIQHNRLRHQ